VDQQLVARVDDAVGRTEREDVAVRLRMVDRVQRVTALRELDAIAEGVAVRVGPLRVEASEQLVDVEDAVVVVVGVGGVGDAVAVEVSIGVVADPVLVEVRPLGGIGREGVGARAVGPVSPGSQTPSSSESGSGPSAIPSPSESKGNCESSPARLMARAASAVA